MDWLRSYNPCIDWLGYEVMFDLVEPMAQSAHVQTPSMTVLGIPVCSTMQIELCSMKTVEHTMMTTSNTAFFALVKPLVTSAKATLPYPKLLQQLDALYKEYVDVFMLPNGMSPQREFDFRIDLVDEGAAPPPPRHYRLSQVEQAEVRKQVATLLEKGWIQPSYSLYRAPKIFVHKKTSNLRMCIDFCMLNHQTKLDVFLIPRIQDILDQLGQATVFLSIDLANAYHWLRIHEPHAHHMAFLTPYGQYKYTVLPFGLTNAPSAF